MTANQKALLAIAGWIIVMTIIGAIGGALIAGRLG